MRLATPPRRGPRRTHAGLTLIELIVAITVAAILFTWAIPSFQQFTARNEVAAEVMRIRTALALARNTAVTRRTTISVCSSSRPVYDSCNFTNWNLDWVIVEGKATGGNLTGDTTLRVLEASKSVDVSFNRDDRPVRISALGWSKGHNGTFTICGRQGYGKQLVINNAGRVRLSASQPKC